MALGSSACYGLGCFYDNSVGVVYVKKDDLNDVIISYSNTNGRKENLFTRTEDLLQFDDVPYIKGTENKFKKIQVISSQNYYKFHFGKKTKMDITQVQRIFGTIHF